MPPYRDNKAFPTLPYLILYFQSSDYFLHFYWCDMRFERGQGKNVWQKANSTLGRSHQKACTFTPLRSFVVWKDSVNGKRFLMEPKYHQSTFISYSVYLEQCQGESIKQKNVSCISYFSALFGNYKCTSKLGRILNCLVMPETFCRGSLMVCARLANLLESSSTDDRIRYKQNTSETRSHHCTINVFF